MRKKFNKLMNISLITSIAVIIIGILLIFFAKMSLDIMGYTVAITLIINGALSILDDYKQFKIFYFFDGFSSGLLSMILGIVILTNPNYVGIIVPITLGLWFILNSTFKLRMALALKDTNNSNWLITYVLSLLTIISGLCLIFNPELGTLSLTKVVGMVSVIYGACDIIDVIIFKKNIKSIAKIFE